MSWHHMEEEELDSRLPLLADQGRRISREDARSVAVSPAMSTVSIQSHEVKHIFEPCASLSEREADAGADYSHIHIRPKPRGSDGGFLGRPPPPAYHRPDGNPPARFHPHVQSGHMPGNVQRFRSPPQTISLEDVTGYELSRRKSWSPPLLRQNMASYHGGQKNTRICYSSNMVDWEPTQQGHLGNPPAYLQGHQHGYMQGHQAHLQNRLQGHMQSYMESHMGCEDMVESLPPRLAPVSGVPPEKLSRNLIRPIAFKPAYARPRLSVCPQCGEAGSCCTCSSFQALQQASQESQPHSQQLAADPMYPRSPSARSADQSSVHSTGHGSYKPAGYGSEPVYLPDDSPGVNVDHSPPCKASGAGLEIVGQTPSPSDSGVGELEAMLKEREAEILTLRQVMDRNERAIFQVYEEKRSQWQADMQCIREEYEQKLKTQQQKATQLEQALTLQIQRLQQDKHHTHSNYTNVQKEATARQSHNQGDGHMFEPESPASPKSSSTPQNQPSSSLQASSVQNSPGEGGQPLSAQDEITKKNAEIVVLRSQLQTLKTELDQKDQQISETMSQVESKSEELKLVHEQLDQLSGVDGVSLCEESSQTVVSDVSGENTIQRPALLSDEEYMQSLERQIDALHQQLQSTESVVESERIQWLEEKNKVIRYQKQLQLNYVQMQRKNTLLEAEVEQLTLELESRHLKLAAMNEEESVC